MEWSLKSVSRSCAACGKVFEAGDDIICMICRKDSGEFLRCDVLGEKAENFSAPGRIIGQWKRKFSGKNSDKESLRHVLASQEEFFFSLYEGDSTREKEILKQIFALLLEKKKVLRAAGTDSRGFQRYVHVASAREFLVPSDDFLPEDLTFVGNVFEMFVP